MIYLIGGRGFVGSACARLFAAKGIEHRVITRENYASFRGTPCDVLINANGNSRKRYSFTAMRLPSYAPTTPHIYRFGLHPGIGLTAR